VKIASAVTLLLVFVLVTHFVDMKDQFCGSSSAPLHDLSSLRSLQQLHQETPVEKEVARIGERGLEEAAAPTTSTTSTTPTSSCLSDELRWLLKGSTPQMQGMEIRQLLSYVSPTTVFLEWGSGGSTLLFPKFTGAYHSIEHNAEWCQKINETLISTESKVNYHCPLMRGGDNGWDETQEGTYHEFKEYVDYVDKLGVNKFDAVLIDGRARLSCAIKILPYLHPTSVVFLHDMFLRDYSFIWELYRPLSVTFSKRGLVALQPKFIAEIPINDKCQTGSTCTVDTTGIELQDGGGVRPSEKEERMRNRLLYKYLLSVGVGENPKTQQEKEQGEKEHEQG